MTKGLASPCRGGFKIKYRGLVSNMTGKGSGSATKDFTSK